MPARIDFFFFDAGGGHRVAATALKTVIDQQERPWQVRLVNLQEMFDEIDVFRKCTGRRIQDAYNFLLKKGWTLGTPQMLRVLQASIRWRHPSQVRLLESFWEENPPDMVVSLIPHFNRALCEAAGYVNPAAPFVTILTDLADYPPHFWIERQQQYLICGAARAVEQALALGFRKEQVFQASGMILRPHFYTPVTVDREMERRKLGLKPGVATGLVLFGGQGSKVMLDIARRLQTVKRDLQLIFICGRNKELAERIRAVESRLPVFVEGFTSEVPYYMRLADFFIGKPGPACISEAVAMNLPVIVERNARTMPQERYNVEWLLENNAGIVVRSFRRIASAVEQLLEPPNLERHRAGAASVKNRAVFEIPGMLAAILETAPPA